MTTRFIRPMISWSGYSLLIEREDEDGYIWGLKGGVRDSIEAYLDHYDELDIDRVEWCVWCEEKGCFETILAKSIDDFVEKFDKIEGLVWKKNGRD